MEIVELNDYLKTNAFLSTDFEKNQKLFLKILVFIVLIFFVLIFFLPIENTIDAFVVFSPETEISTVEINTSGEIISNNIEMGKMVKKGDVLLQVDTGILEEERQLYIKQLTTYENEKEKYEILLNYIRKENQNESNELTMIYGFEQMQFESEIATIQKKITDEQSLPSFAQTPATINDLNLQFLYKKNEYSLWKLEQEKETIDKIHSIAEVIKDTKIHLNNLDEQINYCHVRSPIDGRINIKRNFNIGDFIKEGTNILEIIPTSNYIIGNLYISPENKIYFSEKAEVVLKRENNTKINKKRIKFTISSLSPYPIETEYGNYILAKSKKIDKNLLENNYNLGIQYQCSIIKEKLTIIKYIKKFLFDEL